MKSQPKDITIVNEEFRHDLIENLSKENASLKKQIEDLKRQMVELTFAKEVTPEELICVEQIKVLQNRSAQRELSLDEVKKLDLLVKNMRLIKEQSTENVATPRYRDVTEDLLVQIASGSSESES